MKKSNLFAGLMGLAFMGTTFGFTSCADDRNDLNTNNSKETLTTTANQDVADYTLIVYGCGGGNLDGDFVQEIYYGFSGFGKKVKMAGVYKASKHIQDEVKGTDIAGARYFEAKLKNEDDFDALLISMKYDNTQDSIAYLYKDEKIKKAAEQKVRLSYYKDFCTYFVNEKYDDATMDMGNPNNIAEAIKFVAKKNPAKRYILVTDNHGGGWNVDDDRPNSRSMIGDDNRTDELGQYRTMSLDALNAGVQQSGVKFDALFCNLCLMAYIENLTGYQQNFKFCLASAETTKGTWGFDKLGKRLAAAGANISDDELLSQLTTWVKNGDYKPNWDSYKDMKKTENTDCQDMGVYDLRKISSLTAVMKDIATWYTTAYDNATYKKIINRAVLTSNYISSPVSGKPLNYYNARKQFLSDVGYTTEQVINMYVNGESDKALYDKYMSLTKEKKALITDNYYRYGLTFSHFVNNTIELMKANNLNNADVAKLTQLYNSYQSTLKSMAYIKCSHTDFPGMDPYLWTSPTITLHALNSDVTSKNKMLFIQTVSNIFSMDKAIASYKNTMFDQQTGWSNFLKKLTVTPSMLTNPIRSTAMYDALYK